MNNVHPWTSRSLFGLSMALSGACSDGAEQTPNRATSAAESYTEQFRTANPYVEHAVARGPHKLAAREFTPSSPSAGPLILLMHGYPDSQHLYDRVVPPLRRDRRVVTFDFLGWGASDKPSVSEHRYDAASLRVDLESVVAHFGSEPIVVVVHDASGWPGIDWALDNPERVAALVVLNTVYHPTPTARPPEGLAQFAASGAARDALAERMLNDDALWLDGSDGEGIIGYRNQIGKFFDSSPTRELLLPVFAEESLAMRPAFFALASRLFDEVATRGPAIARMQAFERPVVVAFGSNDPYLNLGVAEDFAARFPTSKRIDIVGANHYVQLDQPDAVAQAILEAGK